MMRIGMPNGLLTSHQARVIGQLTQKHARNLADITTRQNIQLHWLTIGSLVETVDALTEIGMSPKGACGDVVRNVTGCPIAGLQHEELIDASPLAVEVAHLLTANPEFYNLPRKFKITVSGCPLWCSFPEINDIGLTAIKRTVNGVDEIGYTIRVGGGLSTEPHIGVRLNAFIPQDKALDVVTAVVRIFKEQTELRENRTRARIKYLFMKHGWTAESMLAAVEEKLGYKLDPSPISLEEELASIPADIYRDHVGITPQKQPGLSVVGASVLNGRLSGDQLVKLADLADKYGDGHLRATIGQNILIPNVPARETAALVIELDALGLYVDTSAFWRGAIACTGTEFCKLAIAETKAFNKWLVSELEDRLPGFDQQIAYTSPAAPTPADKAGSPTSASKARRSRRTADGRRLLLLRRRLRRQVRRHRPPDRLPRRRRRLPRGHRAPPPRLPRPASARRRPPLLLRPHRRRNPPRPASRSRHRSGRTRRPTRRSRPPRPRRITL